MTLYPMKKIEIIVHGEHLEYVKDLLQRSQASGYTVISQLSGMGHGGYHQGQLMFNDTHTLVMLISVVPEDLVNPVLEGLLPLFKENHGVVFVSDTAVSRLSYFVAATGGFDH